MTLLVVRLRLAMWRTAMTRSALHLVSSLIGGLAALPWIGSVIAGARTPEQVRANAAAARYTPDEATMAALASLPNAR